MSAMITRIIEDTIDPVLPVSNGDKLEEFINSYSEQITQLSNVLGDLTKEKDQVIRSAIRQDKNLESKILEYLAKAGACNEYVIAHDLNENINIVFSALGYLKESGKVCQDKELNWRIKHASND